MFVYMNPQFSKVKTFCYTAFILAAVASCLYALSYVFASDSSVYFISRHPLPMLANSLSIACVIWFAGALVLIPRETLPTGDFMIATGKPFAVAVAPIVGTLAAGTVSFIYYEPDNLPGFVIQQFSLLLQGRAVDPMFPTAICVSLAVIGAALSGAYYLFRTFNVPNLNKACVVLGAGPIALMTGLCGLTYFELDHYMNAPIKIGLQLSWIATMLFVTSELRVTLDKAQPRRYLATACMALFANACAAIPTLPLLFGSTETVHRINIQGYVIMCLCNCIYIGWRLSQFTAFCQMPVQTDHPTETTNQENTPDAPVPPDPEQNQGKDDQDGCQQQDSMAS